MFRAYWSTFFPLRSWKHSVTILTNCIHFINHFMSFNSRSRGIDFKSNASNRPIFNDKEKKRERKTLEHTFSRNHAFYVYNVNVYTLQTTPYNKINIHVHSFSVFFSLSSFIINSTQIARGRSLYSSFMLRQFGAISLKI